LVKRRQIVKKPIAKTLAQKINSTNVSSLTASINLQEPVHRLDFANQHHLSGRKENLSGSIRAFLK